MIDNIFASDVLIKINSLDYKYYETNAVCALFGAIDYLYKLSENSFP